MKVIVITPITPTSVADSTRYHNWAGSQHGEATPEQLQTWWTKHEATRITRLLSEHVGYGSLRVTTAELP